MSLTGRCHCGDTSFEVDGVDPAHVVSCRCSICSRRGALWVYCRPDQFRLAQRPQHEATYTWGKHIARLHFCGRCGCTTYNESPTSRDGRPDFDAPLVAVNARLLDGFDPDTANVQVVEGKDLW